MVKNDFSSKFDFLKYDQPKVKVENDNKSYYDYNKQKELHNYGFTNTNNY